MDAIRSKAGNILKTREEDARPTGRVRCKCACYHSREDKWGKRGRGMCRCGHNDAWHRRRTWVVPERLHAKIDTFSTRGARGVVYSISVVTNMRQYRMLGPETLRVPMYVVRRRYRDFMTLHDGLVRTLKLKASVVDAGRPNYGGVDEAALRRGLSKLPTLPLNPVARELYEHFDRYRVERFVSAANELLKAAAENPVLRSCAILVGFLTPDKMHGIHPYTGALWSEHSTTISVARRTMDRQGMAPFSKTQKELKREEEERARAAKRSSKYGQYVVNA